MADETTTVGTVVAASTSVQVEVKPTAPGEVLLVASSGTIRRAVIAGAFFTALWLGTFTAGALVSSVPFRNTLTTFASQWDSPAGAAGSGSPNAGVPGTSRLDDRTAVIAPAPAGPGARTTAAAPTRPVSAWQAFGALVLAGLIFTPTNLALLCCTAALVGCLGGLVTNTIVDERQRDAAKERAAVLTGEGTTRDVTSQFQIAGRAVTWGFFIFLVVISGSLVLTGDPFQSTTPEQYIRLAGAASLFAFVIGWQPRLLQDLVSRVGSQRVNAGQTQKQ